MMLTPTAPIVVIDKPLSQSTFRGIELGAPVVFFNNIQDFQGFIGIYTKPLLVIINAADDELAAAKLIRGLVKSSVAVAAMEHGNVDASRYILELGCIDVLPVRQRSLCQQVVRRWAGLLTTLLRGGGSVDELIKSRRAIMASNDKPKVALLDDSYGDAMAISSQIADRFNVRWVSEIAHIEEGIARGIVPDAILLDLFFEGEKVGFSLAEQIRQHPVLKSVPVIFHSSNSSERSIQAAYAAGACDYLEKGVGERRAATISTKLIAHVSDARVLRRA